MTCHVHTRPNTHTTPHTHSQYPYTLTNLLIHTLSPSLAHTQLHTHSHTAIFTLTHTPSLVPAPSLAPSSRPLCLLFLCQERPSLDPLTSLATWPPPGSLPSCTRPAPGAFCIPAHVTCISVTGDRSHAWHTAGAHSAFTGSLFTVGAAGRVAGTLSVPGMRCGLSRGTSLGLASPGTSGLPSPRSQLWPGPGGCDHVGSDLRVSGPHQPPLVPPPLCTHLLLPRNRGDLEDPFPQDPETGE